MAGLAVFDLDGTLHHTEKALLPAIRMTLEELGVTDISDQRINSLYGEPLEVFATELLGGRGSDIKSFREGIRRHQRETLPVYGELYPGVPEMLSQAVNSGWTLAILSNAGLTYIELVTTTLNIRDFFRYFRGRDGGEPSKTARLLGLMETSGGTGAVMCGDRYHDIRAAKDLGVPSIGCAYGYGSSVETSEADHIVRTVGEISDVLMGLLS